MSDIDWSKPVEIVDPEGITWSVAASFAQPDGKRLVIVKSSIGVHTDVRYPCYGLTFRNVRRNDDLQAEVAEWLQQAPMQVKQYLAGSIHVCNFLHAERSRGFQIPGANDGAISDECIALFKEQYEICDTMIKVIRTWA